MVTRGPVSFIPDHLDKGGEPTTRTPILPEGVASTSELFPICHSITSCPCAILIRPSVKSCPWAIPIRPSVTSCPMAIPIRPSVTSCPKAIYIRPSVTSCPMAISIQHPSLSTELSLALGCFCLLYNITYSR